MHPESEKVFLAAAHLAAAADAARWREIALDLAVPFAIECEERPPEERWTMACGLGKPLLVGPTKESVVLAWHAQRHTQPKEPT